MANDEQLAVIKQGTVPWNQWRDKHQGINPDLISADLIGAHLSGANLIGANLSRADLSRADLRRANLIGADLRGADLRGANLRDADLSTAEVGTTDLRGANLIGADLRGADLRGANLRDADLRRANLIGADLRGADLSSADLSSAMIGQTSFGDRDFRVIKGLEKVIHMGPSPLSINSLYMSEGDIPEDFVRKTGAPDTFIEYMRSLVRNPIDYYTCFISYSSKDQAFAERLYADLQNKGVRCWFAPEDLKIGEKFRTRIDESIRVYDKLLLVLSEYSVGSPWVETEVEAAFEKEHRLKTLTLFPIKLDETVMQTDQAWAADIRRQRHIGDFSLWKQHDGYQRALTRLLRDLKADTRIPGV